MINKKKTALITTSVAAMALTLAFVAGSPTFADTNASVNVKTNVGFGKGMMQGRGNARGGLNMVKPVAVGQVTAISGSTITITSRGLGLGEKRKATSTAPTSVSTTYTIDASNAVVLKNNATSSVSNIAVGDNVMVQGTLSGTNITATTIRDNVGFGPGGNEGQREGTSTRPAMMGGLQGIQGNGQPVVAGTVSTLSGSILTITNNGSTSYTVDTTNARFIKAGVSGSSTISDVVTGDHVIVQGSVSGTSVAATTIIDQGVPKTSTQGQNPSQNQASVGFFGGIGNFFKHLFGF